MTIDEISLVHHVMSIVISIKMKKKVCINHYVEFRSGSTNKQDIDYILIELMNVQFVLYNSRTV